MSAWDVAGAVVWTPLAVMFWFAIVRLKGDSDAVRIGLPVFVVLALAAVFCIARLAGAHA